MDRTTTSTWPRPWIRACGLSCTILLLAQVLTGCAGSPASTSAPSRAVAGPASTTSPDDDPLGCRMPGPFASGAPIDAPPVPGEPPVLALDKTLTVCAGNRPTRMYLTLPEKPTGNILVLHFSTEAGAPDTGMTARVEQSGTRVTERSWEHNTFDPDIEVPARPGTYIISVARRFSKASTGMVVDIGARLRK